jgi:citronellol/citronellal dehydrogenase
VRCATDVTPDRPLRLGTSPAGDLRGRVAIVTGGATGIGAAAARSLAHSGASVVVASRTRDRLERFAEQLAAETRTRCLAVPTDVRVEQDCIALVERTIEELGTVDVLVNNAGGGRLAKLESTTTALWDNSFALNVRGAFLLTRETGQHMIRARRGSIVNISSVTGIRGVVGGSAFAAAQAGLQMLTAVTAAEWGRFGIRANCIAVGQVATENAERAWREAKLPVDELSRTSALKRVGRAEEVSEVVRFLATEASSFITGQVLCVDGGPRMPGIPVD